MRWTAPPSRLHNPPRFFFFFLVAKWSAEPHHEKHPLANPYQPNLTNAEASSVHHRVRHKKPPSFEKPRKPEVKHLKQSKMPGKKREREEDVPEVDKMDMMDQDSVDDEEVKRYRLPPSLTVSPPSS